jgi:hypothetical protein
MESTVKAGDTPTHETRTWLLVFSATFIASVAVGWFLPDGLNQLARLLDQPEVPTSALTRFFSFLLVFVISAGFESLVWVRRQTMVTAERVTEAVERGVVLGVVAAAESAVLRSAVPYAAGTPGDASIVGHLLKTFGTLLAAIPPGLLAGYSVMLENGLATLRNDVDAVASPGLKISIREHLEITRRLAREAKTFTQINRRAYLAPQQWTQEWLHLVDELGARDLATEYIVLMSAKDLAARTVEIESMREYLTEHRWMFKCCEIEQVRDALGGRIPTEANVDVYDSRVAKLQTPPEGRYRGGIELDMTLADLDHRPDLLSFVMAVRQFAVASTGGRAR